MIDSAAVRIVNAFEDMARWPITAGITRVELRPGRGIVVHYVDATPVWPDFHLDNDPTFGLVRSTLALGFRINGQWVMSGFLNFWAHEGRRRTDSGAHPLEAATEGPRAGTNNWQANFAYNTSWGPLDAYVPREGDLMAIMLTAGGTRQSKTRTVNERTQLVTVPLQMNGAWDFAPTTEPVDPPIEPVVPPVDPPVPAGTTPVTLADEQYDAIMTRFDEADAHLDEARAEVKEAGEEAVKQLPGAIRKAIFGR